MASSLRRSQIQKQVLSLYKECLRAAEVKSPSFKSVVRNEFKRNGAAIQRTDTMRVEYMLRQGKRRLEMMKVLLYKTLVKRFIVFSYKKKYWRMRNNHYFSFYRILMFRDLVSLLTIKNE